MERPLVNFSESSMYELDERIRTLTLAVSLWGAMAQRSPSALYTVVHDATSPKVGSGSRCYMATGSVAGDHCVLPQASMKSYQSRCYFAVASVGAELGPNFVSFRPVYAMLTFTPAGASGGKGILVMPVRLRFLLEQRHWQNHRTFCMEYEKAAISIDPRLRGTAPSRSQLHRWLSGELKDLPYDDHCRVLEKMFPEWSARQLFESISVAEISRITARRPSSTEKDDRTVKGFAISHNGGPFADVTAVFVSRSEFAHRFPLDELLSGVSEIRAVGISLNLLCQDYGDRRLRSLLDSGCTIRCLFLDPHGYAIKAREHEEGYAPGLLSSLTVFNLQIMERLRLELPDEKRERIQLHVYDEPARFNITIADDRKCIVQPYLPAIRGVDSPTFVIDRCDEDFGLFSVFGQVFDTLWKRSRPIG